MRPTGGTLAFAGLCSPGPDWRTHYVALLLSSSWWPSRWDQGGRLKQTKSNRKLSYSSELKIYSHGERTYNDHLIYGLWISIPHKKTLFSSLLRAIFRIIRFNINCNTEENSFNTCTHLYWSWDVLSSLLYVSKPQLKSFGWSWWHRIVPLHCLQRSCH